MLDDIGGYTNRKGLCYKKNNQQSKTKHAKKSVSANIHIIRMTFPPIIILILDVILGVKKFLLVMIVFPSIILINVLGSKACD